MKREIPLEWGWFDGWLFVEVVLADAFSHGEYKNMELMGSKEKKGKVDKWGR